MPRPTKWRRVEFVPSVKKYVPGDGQSPQGETVLLVEEMEAIRLKDVEKLDQEVCAQRMEVSRQTFQRILTQARAKLAEALVNGRTIKIAGGTYTRNICRLHCSNCGHEWTMSFEEMDERSDAAICPQCGHEQTSCEWPGHEERRRGYGRGGRFCKRHCAHYERRQSFDDPVENQNENNNDDY